MDGAVVRCVLGKRLPVGVDITGVGKMTLNASNILALPVNLEMEGKIGAMIRPDFHILFMRRIFNDRHHPGPRWSAAYR